MHKARVFAFEELHPELERVTSCPTFCLVMARNIEIKARISKLEEWLPRAAALADGPRDDLAGRFSRAPTVALNFEPSLRAVVSFYQREDCAEPKNPITFSGRFRRSSRSERHLTQAYGVRGRIRKLRYLFMAGRTRIHLDRVEGLGDFLELEVVLRDDESNGAGVQEATDLLKKLGVPEKDLVERAYVDLLRDQPALTPL